MDEFAQALLQALNSKQYELFLNALAVEAARKSNTKEGQGILSGSRDLDTLCTQAATVLAADFPLSPLQGSVDEGLTLYIATDLYWGQGGHTPLLMDLIKVDRSARKELILTVTGGHPKSAEFSHHLNQALPSGVTCHQLQSDSLLQKILILRSYIRERRPRRIILMTHQFDVVTYCGLTPDMATQLIKVLHADTFTLGLHIPWYIPVSPNSLGAQTIANTIGRGVFIWPIAAPDLGQRQWPEWQNNSPIHTCSHGTERKFEGSEEFTYDDIVVMRLKLRAGPHYHIGDLSEKRRKAIEDHLIAAGVRPDRFIHVPAVPSLWEYLKNSPIQLCISSYPVCGPRGLVETKGCGIPVLMYEDIEHPIRSSIYYAYPQCLRWSNARELESALLTLNPEQLRDQAFLARADYEKRHSLKAMGEQAVIPDNFTPPRMVLSQ